MSTDYLLIPEEDTTYDGKFIIDEMSNRLSLVFCDNEKRQDKHWFSSKELTPEEMAEVFLTGLTVCSYWMDTDKLKEMIKKHSEKELY